MVKPTRITLHQSLLPRYRIPVFSKLSKIPGVKFTLIYTNRKDGPPSAEATDFFAFKSNIYKIPLVDKRYLLFDFAQIKYASIKKTDVLILSWDMHYLTLIPALIRAKKAGIRTILWGHGYSKNETSHRRRIRETSARFASAVLLYNHTNAERLIKSGYDPNRIYVAPNALDQAPIQNARRLALSDKNTIKNFRLQHNLPDQDIILFVSRLNPANRLDLAIHAIQLLSMRRPKATLVVIGEGSELLNLKKLAYDLGVMSHCRFIGSIYNESKLAPWFLCSDIFCYPSNIGLSLLHAFGYGLPVVTTDNRALQNPEIDALVPGRNGLNYSHNNAVDLAHCLEEILSDRKLLNSMSIAAYKTVTNRYTLNNMIAGFCAAINGDPSNHEIGVAPDQQPIH